MAQVGEIPGSRGYMDEKDNMKWRVSEMRWWKYQLQQEGQ